VFRKLALALGASAVIGAAAFGPHHRVRPLARPWPLGTAALASASLRQRPSTGPIATSLRKSSRRRSDCASAASRSAIKRVDHGREIAPASP
jgi:hypothetical protein